MQQFQPALRIFFIYSLLLLAISFHTFLTGLDIFGFFIGAYGISLTYPWNLLGQIIVVALLSGYGLGIFIFLTPLVDNQLAIVLTFALTSVIFMLIAMMSIIPAVIIDVALFTLLIMKEFQINKRGRSIDELEADQNHVKIILGIISVVALTNYALWFSIKESYVPTTFSFTALLLPPAEFIVRDYIPISPYQYYQILIIGSSISFLLRAIILGVYSLYLLQISAKHIALKKNYAAIWQISQKNNTLLFDFCKPTDEYSNTVVANSKYRFVFAETESPVAALYEEGLALYSGIIAGDHVRLQIFQEQKLQHMGVNLKNFYNLSEEIFTAFFPTRAILLSPYHSATELALENLYFPTKLPLLKSIAEYATVFRQINEPGLPLQLPKQKRILHIGSLELPSILLQKKLEKLTTDHQLTFHALPSQQSLATILQGNYDILIISLHGTLDGDNNPFYYYFDADEQKYTIFPEDFKDAFSSPIPIVLTPTCLTTSPLSTVDFPEIFLSTQSDIVVASSIPVLTSHLPLIILSFVESIVKYNEITLIDLHKIMSEVYFAIKRFGFITQWNFLRTYVRAQITQN